MSILLLGNYRLSFVAVDDVPIRRYSGSAWRGLFGHALKKTLCITRGNDCSRCLLYYSCGYSYLFETPPPPDAEKMRKYRAVPHPFVIIPLQTEDACYKPSEYFSIGIRLFGRANRHLPYVVQSWKIAGSLGFGQGGGHRFQLATVLQEAIPGSGEWNAIYRPDEPLKSIPPAPPEVPAKPDRVHIALRSPLRLNRESRPVAPEDFTFSDLFRPLLRRTSMLSYFHGEQPLEVDFKQLSEQSDTVELVEPKLHWQKWTRHSSRQKTSINMSGIEGEFHLDPGQLDAFWPYLWLGQWLGVGKGTVMGQGRYQINAASLPDMQIPIQGGTIEAKAQVAGNSQAQTLDKAAAAHLQNP